MTSLAESFVPEELAPTRFRFPSPPEGRGVVFGGHILGQMIVAASRGPTGKGQTGSVRCAHAVFARTVGADIPSEATVDPLHVGRVLATAMVSVWQQASERARGVVMVSTPEPDLIRHQAPAPDVGPPSEAPQVEDPLGREVRVVGGIDRGDPDVVAPPALDVWVRYPSAPDLPGLRQALTAHATAGFLMGTAMLPHPGIGERMAHRSFSTGIVAHSISFHEAVDPSGWLLISQESSHAGHGRAFGVGRVYTETGMLVASFSQEAIVRPFPEGHSPEGREETIL